MSRVKYSANYNPIIEYWEKIRSGEIKVSKKVYETYKKLVFDVNNPGEFFYSAARANHFLEFAENYCRHSKGKLGGQRVRLMLWEKAPLAAAFGFVDINGIRKYNRVVLIVGKKNGKSLISSIVGLYLQIADSENGPEIYAVATKRDQAKIIWQEAKRMVNKSPSLRKRIKPLAYEMTSESFNDGVFKPLASDSNTLDGLNVHGALLDEIHQWRNGRELYDIIVDGITAREQPLIFITSTAGKVREDIYDFLYDEGKRIINGYSDPGGYKDEHSLFLIYELDHKEEWENEGCWIKANPGLGVIKNYNTLKDKVEKAKHNPDLVKNLLCKEFNIPETTAESWLEWDTLNNEATFSLTELRPRYGIGGADLSSTTDLTAAKCIFMLPNDETIYVLQMYWIPADLVDFKVKKDKIPYDIWIEKGYMRTCPGRKIDPSYVTKWFKEIQNDLDIYIWKVGYDAWSAEYWVKEMRYAFGAEVMEEVRQGKKTLSNPMKNLKTDLEAKIINYNNNPIDKWCLANTSKDEDKNGNIQPIKTSVSTRRIDGTAALLDAYTVLENYKEEYLSII